MDKYSGFSEKSICAGSRKKNNMSEIAPEYTALQTKGVKIFWYVIKFRLCYYTEIFRLQQCVANLKHEGEQKK